jgi:hypothetical protein
MNNTQEYRITAFSMWEKPQTYIATGKEELAEIVLSLRNDQKLIQVEEVEE